MTNVIDTAITDIDSRLGDGFARQHPEVLAAYLPLSRRGHRTWPEAWIDEHCKLDPAGQLRVSDIQRDFPTINIRELLKVIRTVYGLQVKKSNSDQIIVGVRYAK